jgi:predicted amidohydrolase
MRKIRLAAIQLEAADIEQHVQTLSHSLELIDEAADAGAQLAALPECTYPAYFLRSPGYPAELGVLRGAEVAARYAAKAKQRGIHIAVGVAFIHDDGHISNTALLIDSEGSTVGAYEKAFLWHFDNEWFSCGTEYPVFDTALGRIGIFICADGRQPEIARAICLQRPDLVLDLTAWVSWGRNRSSLTSPQPDHLIPMRAMENGAWIAAAGKSGSEAGSILYCGSSCLVSPTGEVHARASSDREEVLVWDVTVERPASPPFARRPELYGDLAKPTADLPAVALTKEPVQAGRTAVVAAAQLEPYEDGEALVEWATRIIESGRAQGVQLYVLPAYDPARADSFLAEDHLGRLANLVRDEVLVVPLAENGEAGLYRTAFTLYRGEVIATYRQTHLRIHAGPAGTLAGDQLSPVVNTPVGRLGLMVGADLFVPEVARCLMLNGAELIAWSGFEPPSPALTFARGRAEENRVWLVAASVLCPSGGAAVIEPSGREVATAPLDCPLTISAQVNPALARWKERAPGTDVVFSRQPATYRSLVGGEVHLDVSRPAVASRG